MKLIRYTQPAQYRREFGDPFRVLDTLFARSAGTLRQQNPAPGVEWFEDDSHYHARVELPGAKREDLRLEAEEGLLRLSHETSDPGKGEGEESRVARTEFVLRCPEEVRTEGIEARLADGILQLSLPKAEVRKPVTVQIG
ncbi:MAG TPA: Hsp20/alpha crystallin family protein [Bacteroidia bacterium]|nr:Hsp20/alpha crystallin family protein [Bacteroidia bacterium]